MGVRKTAGTGHDPTRPSTIVSIGYEGRPVNELIAALVDAGVSVLVDVRENAISRKPGLSKRALAASCEANGITYVHEPTLGNPRDNRVGFRAQRLESLARYDAHLAESGAAALDRVAALLRDHTVGLLLCFEADPCTCHRSVVVRHVLDRQPMATVWAL